MENDNKLQPGKDIIYFDNDDEFYRFCVVPALYVVTKKNNAGGETLTTDFDLSYAYKDAIDKGIKFCIKDQDSQIFKHGCVAFSCVNKPVENLVQYFGEDYIGF